MNNIKINTWNPTFFSKNLFSPPKRWGHASFIFSDFLYVLGGTVGSNEEEYLKVIYKIYLKDINCVEWFIIDPIYSLPIIPFNRDSMGCEKIKNNVYIFGGCVLGKNSTNEILVFDIYKEIWKKVETKNEGFMRDSFSSFVHDNKYIFILGGITTIKNEHNLEEDDAGILYYLDIEENKWETINDDKIIKKFPYSHIWNHKGILYNNNFYFYGGIIKDSEENDIKLSNELWELKIDTTSDNFEYEFNLIDYTPFGEKIPLMGHTCNLIETKLVIIGGETLLNGSKIPNKTIFYYDFLKNKTFQLKMDLENYNGLIKHTCNNYKDKLIIFGGKENDIKTNNLLELNFDNSFFNKDLKNINKDDDLKCFNCKMNYKLTKNSLNFDINMNLKLNIPEYLLGYYNGQDILSIKEKLKIFINFCLKFSNEIDNNFQAFTFLLYLFKDSKDNRIKYNLNEKLFKGEFKSYPKTLAFELLTNFEFNSNNFIFFCCLIKWSTKVLIGFMDGKSTFLIYFEYVPFTNENKIFFNDYGQIKKLFKDDSHFDKILEKIKKNNSFLIYLLDFNYSEELYINKNSVYQKQYFSIISDNSEKIKLKDYIKISLSNYKNKLHINKELVDFSGIKKKLTKKQLIRNHLIIKSFYIKNIDNEKYGQILIYSKDLLIQIIEIKGKNAIIEIIDNDLNIFKNKLNSLIENSIIDFVTKYQKH